MADKDISGADGAATFSHWHDTLYDVLAMLQGAGAFSAEEHGSGNLVRRLLNEAIARLEESIDGLDACRAA
ncbi:MAG: hypothetical protein QFE16_01310 [Pseudomonadota bacterium]|nr:hypothetical protein [Pseudomonadota bacterium]